MTPASETVTQLLRRRIGERAFGKQLADEEYSAKVHHSQYLGFESNNVEVK